MARLAGLAGYEELASRARLVNLLPAFPGKNGKGDAFPVGTARLVAERMRLRGLVLLAGRNVGEAFGLAADYFEWRRRGATRYVVIPHPSGVSRWWNDPRNVIRASAFLRGVFS